MINRAYDMMNNINSIVNEGEEAEEYKDAVMEVKGWLHLYITKQVISWFICISRPKQGQGPMLWWQTGTKMTWRVTSKWTIYLQSLWITYLSSHILKHFILGAFKERCVGEYSEICCYFKNSVMFDNIIKGKDR